jgi:hypothetical protein
MRKTQSRLRDAAVATVLALALPMLAKPAAVSAEVLCADDLVPFGMAVTATGTAPSCDGSCRAREIKPVCGLVMKICAGQPIPKGYTLDSITSLPGCQCLGYDEDAYVIRYTGPDGPAAILSSNNSDQDNSGAPRRTPFGNPLCMANAAQIWSSTGGYGAGPSGAQGFPTPQYPGAQGMVPWGQSGPGMSGMGPNMPGMPSGGAGQFGSPWNSQPDEEPFRVGQ